MEGHVSSRVWVSRESVGGRAELRMQDGIGFASDGGALPGHQHGRGGLFTTPQGHAGGQAYGQAPNDHGHDAHGRPSTHPQFFHQGGGQQAMHPGMAYSHPSMTGAYETPSMPTQTGHMLPGASSDSMMHPHASAFHVGPTQPQLRQVSMPVRRLDRTPVNSFRRQEAIHTRRVEPRHTRPTGIRRPSTARRRWRMGRCQAQTFG